MDTKEPSRSGQDNDEQSTDTSGQAELLSLRSELQHIREAMNALSQRNSDLESQVMNLGNDLKNERRAIMAVETRLNRTIDQLWSSIGDLAKVPNPNQRRTHMPIHTRGSDSSDDELRWMTEPPHSNPPMHFHEFADSKLLRPRASDEAIGAAVPSQK
jgi:septal ring factor EnvC (AmiA/AmiB activator)